MNLTAAYQFQSLQTKCKGHELSHDALHLLESQHQDSDRNTFYPTHDALRDAIFPAATTTNNNSSSLLTVSSHRQPLPLLVASGQAIPAQLAFWRTCEERGIFEVYSDDLITLLLHYLETRAKRLLHEKGIVSFPLSTPPMVVLEIGAGNGKLTRAVRPQIFVVVVVVVEIFDVQPS